MPVGGACGEEAAFCGAGGFVHITHTQVLGPLSSGTPRKLCGARFCCTCPTLLTCACWLTGGFQRIDKQHDHNLIGFAEYSLLHCTCGCSDLCVLCVVHSELPNLPSSAKAPIQKDCFVLAS